MKAEKLPRLSVEEYIQHEIQTGQKHEYHDGMIYALAGGTIEHALLIGNVYSELRNSLRKKGNNCKPITNDAKLHIKKENSDLWRITRFEGIDQQIKLQSLDIDIRMEDLYYDVDINKNID